MGEVSIFCAALVGAGLGFLWFNAPPAKIFMGDTGSLATGGAIGAISVMTRNEFVLGNSRRIVCFRSSISNNSGFIFQVNWKRVFKMAPLHHHFEQKGWAEPTIVIRFWIITIILAMISLLTLKSKMIIKKYKKQTNKNILILGYGKTGKSIASFLKNKKFNIYFWDDNKEILNKINSRFLKYTKQNLNIIS